ncbi:hypothetical protein [Paraburkholderia caribensis]|uniref:hypothetical protein n=1 Tax=Paraburkholderia caribensis TaxID=75105 RepID=UPI000AC8A1BC|nr:hypothetical protein [Paraburkholderia caribensis]
MNTPEQINPHAEGDKGKAICASCNAIVPTTFLRRDVPFSDKSGKVANLLVSVCDICGATVAIPAQSVPAIKKARESKP